MAVGATRLKPGKPDTMKLRQNTIDGGHYVSASTDCCVAQSTAAAEPRLPPRHTSARLATSPVKEATRQ